MPDSTPAMPVLPSDALVKRLFEVSPDPITVVELDSGKLLMLNEPFLALTGYRADDLRGRDGEEMRLWVEPGERDRYFARLRAEGGVRNFEGVLQTRDGRALATSINATVFEHDGRRYVLAIARDISGAERRRLQLEAILDNAVVGIAFTRDRNFQHANPRFEEIFGWPSDAMVGEPGRVVWASDAAYAEIGRVAGPLLATGAAFEGEFEMARRDGSLFWASLRARAIDPRHPGAGTIWIVDDISERRRTEHALAAAKEQAESASRAKSEFLANTSHEIRTPLNGLLGLVRLAQEPGVGAARLREYLERIDDSAQALAGLISDILDLSKIEAGQLTLEQVDFDLHGLLGTMRAAYSELARAKGLGFRLDVGENVPQWVSGDPVRLRQILANYMSNALKFTEHGAIQAAVRRPARQAPAHPGARHRSGRRPGAAAASVPSVFAGRRVDDAPLRRHRARPEYLPPARGADGRRRRHGEPPRQRQPVLGRPAALRGDAAPARRGAARGRRRAARRAHPAGRGQRRQHARRRGDADAVGRRGGGGRKRRRGGRCGGRERRGRGRLRRRADGPADAGDERHRRDHRSASATVPSRCRSSR